jgi:hypothetical protein
VKTDELTNKNNAIKIINAIEKNQPVKFNICTGKEFKEILNYINRYLGSKKIIENS